MQASEIILKSKISKIIKDKVDSKITVKDLEDLTNNIHNFLEKENKPDYVVTFVFRNQQEMFIRNYYVGNVESIEEALGKALLASQKDKSIVGYDLCMNSVVTIDNFAKL